jgi:hypothetical protein
MIRTRIGRMASAIAVAALVAALAPAPDDPARRVVLAVGANETHVGSPHNAAT